MDFMESLEQEMLRAAVRDVAEKFGHDYFAAQARADLQTLVGPHRDQVDQGELAARPGGGQVGSDVDQRSRGLRLVDQDQDPVRRAAGQLRPAEGDDYKYRYIVMPMRI